MTPALCNALEPDCPTTHSQPEASRIGLRLLACVGGLDEHVAEPAAARVASVLTSEGAVPLCLPGVSGYPRAAWWKPTDPLVADITPIGGIVAVLRKADVDAQGLLRAEQWCYDEHDRQRAAGEPVTQYHAHSMAELCSHAADAARAQALLDDLRERLAGGTVIPLDPAVRPEPDTHTPLDLAPTPDHPLRSCFDDRVINAFLDRLEADQQPDGCWPIDWPAPGDTAVWEWRRQRTLEALETLRAYDRLHP